MVFMEALSLRTLWDAVASSLFHQNRGALACLRMETLPLYLLTITECLISLMFRSVHRQKMLQKDGGLFASGWITSSFSSVSFFLQGPRPSASGPSGLPLYNYYMVKQAYTLYSRDVNTSSDISQVRYLSTVRP